jgi:hypothetical protein
LPLLAVSVNRQSRFETSSKELRLNFTADGAPG